MIVATHHSSWRATAVGLVAVRPTSYIFQLAVVHHNDRSFHQNSRRQMYKRIFGIAHAGDAQAGAMLEPQIKFFSQ